MTDTEPDKLIAIVCFLSPVLGTDAWCQRYSTILPNNLPTTEATIRAPNEGFLE